jgi:hypothetical protein
VSSR